MKSKLTLLYVEDDHIVRENFKEIFQTYFEEVITAENGNDALKLYKKNSIDVAILDISIPGMNGLNVASKIREKDDKTVILIISAHSDKEKLLKAVNLGLFGYLVKPVTHKELDKSIQKILNSIQKVSLVNLTNSYSWDSINHTLFHNDRVLKLTKNEMRIVKILVDNKNKHLNACAIQERLFNEKESGDEACNNIVQLLSRLKKKIFKLLETNEYFIESGYGSGYKIIINS